jgi:hypothetical protein
MAHQTLEDSFMRARPIVQITLLSASIAAVLLCGAAALSDQGPVLADARLGFVPQSAVMAVNQPVVERYGADVRKRVADATHVSIVDIPAIGGQTPEDAATCRALHITGFVEPKRNYRIGADAVAVGAGLSIRDCFGHIFYANMPYHVQKRDDSLLMQQQLDDAEASATISLLADLAHYVREHAPIWHLLLRTGTIEAATPSP